MSDDFKTVPAELIPAMKAKLEAETVRALAEARIFTADAIVADYGTQHAAMNFEREQYKRSVELAQNHYHHVYPFSGEVSSASAATCSTVLSNWVRMDQAADKPPSDIEIVFFSPGGSITDGMALYDYIQTVRRAGHKVTTSCIGMAASMAGILLQAGDVRVMNRESWLMIHEASFGASGKTWEIEDRVEWVKKVQERILDIFAVRAKNSDAEKPISRAALKRNWSRKDWWISSEEALKLGLADVLR